MAGVLPRRSATASTAATTFLFACVGVAAPPRFSSATAARTVAAQVRKSFALKSRPVICRRYAVDVVGIEAAAAALRVEVLEEHVTGQGVALGHDGGQPAVADRHHVVLAALAPEAEVDHVAGDGDVPVAQRGQAERAVRLRVLLVPDADQRRLEQADQRGQHLLARQARGAQVPCHPPPDAGQGEGKGEHAVELGRVAHLAEARVVPVLLAALGVAAGGLDVAAVAGGDPHVAPRGRNRQGTDAGRDRLIADGPAVGPDVPPARARPLPANARPFLGDVGEARREGGPPRITDPRAVAPGLHRHRHRQCHRRPADATAVPAARATPPRCGR